MLWTDAGGEFNTQTQREQYKCDIICAEKHKDTEHKETQKHGSI